MSAHDSLSAMYLPDEPKPIPALPVDTNRGKPPPAPNPTLILVCVLGCAATLIVSTFGEHLMVIAHTLGR
jgi:hypothetical protein